MTAEMVQSGTVLDHMRRAIAFTQNNVGSHGLPLLGFADWNDTVNLRAGAESLFVANLYGKALLEMIELARHLVDGTHVTQRVLQGGAEYTPLFRVPPASVRAALLEALGGIPVPQVQAEKPVLVEWWRRGEADQLHLVNYADAPQEVVVALPWVVQVRAFSPDTDDVLALEGRSLRVHLDVYTILETKVFEKPTFSQKPGFLTSCREGG
jgi:hypothetical protein